MTVKVRVLSGPAGSLQGERPSRPAALARPRRSDEEACRPPSLIRLGWPDQAYSRPDRPPALARLNRHSEACCHAGPTRLARNPVAHIGNPVVIGNPVAYNCDCH